MKIDNENFVPKKSYWISQIVNIEKVTPTEMETIDDKVIPEIAFNNSSAGEIFNTYQSLSLGSMWDVRMNGNLPSVILGRPHMYYYNNTNETKTAKEYIQVNLKDINEKYTSIIDKNNRNISNLYRGLYAGFLLDYSINSSSKNIFMMDAYNMIDPQTIGDEDEFLNRVVTRKISENHFAISYYNLIGYQIMVNDDVANVVSSTRAKSSKSLSHHLTIIPQTHFKNIYGKDNSEFKYNEKLLKLPTKSLDNDSDRTATYANYEFLLNGMLRELSYAYQGKIIIKFNDDIEIGDTITLIDMTSSSYGIFEIDAFEHSLDERGLITTLTVKAKVSIVDPCLDLYALDIGYEVSKLFSEKCKLETTDGVTTNFKLQNIYGVYMQQLLQIPKYIHHYYLTGENGFFETIRSSSEIGPQGIRDFEYAKPSLIIRFMPFVKKTKSVFPKSLEDSLVFQDADLRKILKKFYDELCNALSVQLERIARTKNSLKNFVIDQILGMVTFNLYDMFKPMLGITSSKAYKELAGDTYNITKSNRYTPYDGLYTIGNYDFVISLFNVQAQKLEDFLPVKIQNVKKEKLQEEEFALKYYKKTETINKIIREVCDVALLVEVYDSYSTEKYKGIFNKFNCNMDDFIERVYPRYFEYNQLIEISTNETKSGPSNEYGACFAKNKNKILKNEQFFLNNKMDIRRSAVHTVIDIQELNIKKINKLHILWFHNVYKENKIKRENIYKVRRRNVEILLEYGELLLKTETDSAVIIAGDFNLNIYNNGEMPAKSRSFEVNMTMELNDTTNFVSMNNRATVLNKKGEVKYDGNPFDNALVSNNFAIEKYLNVFPFAYSMDDLRDRRIVSDHIPLLLCFKKQK